MLTGSNALKYWALEVTATQSHTQHQKNYFVVTFYLFDEPDHRPTPVFPLLQPRIGYLRQN